MAFKIPFSLLPSKVLYRFSHHYLGFAQRVTKSYPNIDVYLNQAEAKMTSLEYVSLCLVSLTIFGVIMFFLALFTLMFGASLYIPFLIALTFTFFVFLQQMAYPKLAAMRRVKEIDKNLLPALQDMLVQLNSGIPLFNILVNVARGSYGAISIEFKNTIQEINAGRNQIDALEDIAVRNPSVLFRRTLWQLVNGMKEGADIASLIKEVMRAVGDEQLTQIQRYGGQLSPLALFYMLIAIIAPSLGVTFIIVLSSFVALSPVVTKTLFFGLLGFTILFQILFLGMIKTRRPALLE
ncbi:MAG: type II secretion system F family protein [Nanoarchaeota archaeon]